MTTSRALRRLLCLLLTLTMVLSVTVPAFANPLTEKTAETPLADGRLIEQEEHALSDIVRVTIELDQPSTFDAGYSMNNVAENAAAVSYRQSLRSSQAALTNQIEAAVGSKLDVKWNITLTMNAISANVRYGDIAKIKSIPGVKDVFLENRYDPPTTVEGEEGDQPNTANTSTFMVGAADTWAEGYTGAGSRIAIIDTGLDTSHQSMNADAFNYAIQQTGKTVSLFTSANLSSIKSQLNGSGATYVSAKIPFGYNYVDENTTINHLSDTQGEHGSHVAGIAAANRYIKSGSSYVEAADSVHAVGMAPDAQLFIMKVFGSGGGAYDSDYMVAIEDAIVLGCDAVNLSLGSSSQGFTYSTSYQSTLNKIANASSNTKTVVSISAGNAYDFPYWLDNGELYIQDAYMHTGGSPGSYTNSLCVASADNTGVTGSPLTFNGSQKVFYNETDSTGAKMTTIGGSYSYVYVDAPGNASDYSTVNSAVSLSGKIVICNRGDISFYEKGNNLISYSPKALIVANNAAGAINMSLDDYTGTFPMVSITLADANTIKANSTAHTAGSITYYTGTVSVSSEVSHMQVTDNAEMSVFSSWGVPGSLLMKPEITAPGGNIYSLWGTNKTSSGTVGGSDKYELMSGTSMAAPHVTGLTATLGQYLRENSVTLSGHTTRQIAQSLLMSTAVPMHIGSKTGPYYPTIQVGAGLVNVHNAVHASSVIFMGSDATASYADGKVKAELGDLPAKQGSWSYTFQINNMASKAQTYALHTDLFTQDVDNSGNYPLMSKSTTNLNWPVTYTVDGASATSVTVAAGSSKTVKVTITVPSDMSAFDAIYPAGCYLEGYTFVESSTTSSDGEKLDVQHSIPILGYYGSWTDPSMFDNMSYVDANVYGVTRTPYSGVSNTNYMTYTRGSSSSTKYVTGNPYTVEQPFPDEKLALRSTDTIKTINYMLLRSAGTTGFAACKLDDGDQVTSVLSATVSSTNVLGLYWGINSAQTAYEIKNNSAKSYSVNKTVSTYGSEGDHIRVGFYAIPEYNAMKVNADITSNTAGYLTSSTFQTVLKQNVLGRGAMIGYDFFIDDTAPEILSAVTNGSQVTVTVRDNCYVAWLAITNSNGTTTYASVVPDQTAKGETVNYTFDISSLNLATGSYKVLAGDYASNETSVAPTENLYEITAVSNNDAWGAVSVNGNVITATPAEGYYAAGYEVVSGTATVTQNGNVFTVSATEDCTIRIIFAAKEQITVTYMANGSVMSTATGYSGDAITLPATATAVDNWTFLGWIAQQLDETAEKPEYYAPGASFTPTANTTLYALYTRLEEGTGETSYKLIESAPADWSGNYVITYGSNDSLVAFKSVPSITATTAIESAANASTLSASGMTLADGMLTNVAASYVFAVEPNGNSYTIRSKDQGYYVGMNNASTNAISAYPTYTASYCDWTIGAISSVHSAQNAASVTYPYLSYSTQNSYFWSGSASGSANASVNWWKEQVNGTYYYSTNPVNAEHEHTMEYVAAVAPTCGAEGHTAYYHCTVCGKYYSDANGENEITLASTVIPATGNHSFGAYVSNNNGTHKHVCSVCGAEETEDCTYTDVVTAPTATEQGYTTHTCTVCGYSFVDSYTAPLGNDFPVHFSVPAGVTAPADMISNTNTGITLPTAEAPEGYTFLGWVTEDYDNVETRPTTILTGTYIAPQEITLKALYTYTEGNSGSETVYELVSTAPSEIAGDYVITFGTSETSNEQGFFLMKGVEAATSNYGIETPANRVAYADTGATLDGTTLKNVANDYVFNVAFLGTYYTIQSKSTGIYLGMNNSSYFSGYGTYNSTYCRWTIPAVADNFCSAKNARSAASYPYISFGYESDQYSEPYFWAGSSSSIGATGLALSVRWWKATEIEAGTSYYTTIIGEEHVHTPAAPVKENEVPATCTEAGSYDSVVYCTECGEEISRETVTVPALGHTPGTAVKENEVAATCTTAGGYDMVVYCTVCNEELSREHTETPATGHSWGEWISNNDGTHTRTCAACGETETHDCEFGNDTVCDDCGYEKKLNFSASLSLDNATGFNYKVAVAEVDALGLDSFHLVVVHTAYDKATNTYNDETVTLEGSKSGSYYSFDFADIPAMALNDKMVAHLEGTKNGETWSSNAIDFNAIDYCYLVTTLTSQPESLRRTCANLILFAESAQINFSYNTANLPTAKWSDVQENLCDRTVPTWTTDNYSEPLEGATVTFGGLMLDVNSRIDLRFVIVPGNLNAEDLTAEIHYEGLKGASKSFTIPGSEWTDYGTQGRKAVTLHEMNAGELQSSVAIVIKDANGNAVSSTLHYSVDNYAGILYNLSSTSSEMKNMMVTMINYSLRAKVYLETK